MKLPLFSALALLLMFDYALAVEAAWYVVSDLATGKCTILTKQPDTSKYKLMGAFPTREAAQKAMGGMSDCQQ